MLGHTWMGRTSKARGYATVGGIGVLQREATTVQGMCVVEPRHGSNALANKMEGVVGSAVVRCYPSHPPCTHRFMSISMQACPQRTR